MSTDAIVKSIVLHVPQTRLWQALVDSEQFGEWFGVRFDGPFVADAPIRGVMTPTTVDATVAEAQKPYAGMPFDLVIGSIQPERLFSFRWHPFAVEPDVDYSGEPTTLIEFRLQPQADSVLLTITESGFDQIPSARRAKAFDANSGGWQMCLTLIEKYVTGSGSP